MKTFCRLTYRVPFSETDAMGIVHHANHPKYLERGRVEFLRLTDFSYVDIVKSGFHFPLTEMNVSYKKPILFDDVILIETAVAEVSKVRMTFSYKIFSISALREPQLSTEAFDGRPLAVGETFHCCTNESGRPVEMPAALYDCMLKLWGEQP